MFSIFRQDVPSWVIKGHELSGPSASWKRMSGGIWRVTCPETRREWIVRAQRAWSLSHNADKNPVTGLRNHACWSNVLARGGFPAPSIRSSFFRRGWMREQASTREDWIGREHMRPEDKSHRLASARLLARLHRFHLETGAPRVCLPTWRADARGPREIATPGQWWRRAWGWRIHASRRRFEEAARAGVGGIDGALVRRLEALIDEAESRARRFLSDSPPWRIVHGDLHPENLCFDLDGNLHLLDLEWTHVGLSGLELARARRRLCAQADHEAWGEFLDAYAKAGADEEAECYLRHEGAFGAVHELAHVGNLARRLLKKKKLRGPYSITERVLHIEQMLASAP